MNHDKVYSKAFFYDVAFRFKDIKMESKSLIDVYQEINGRLPKSFLDIAAGPAKNDIFMASTGYILTNEDMVKHIKICKN